MSPARRPARARDAAWRAEEAPLRGGAVWTATTDVGMPVVVRPMPGFAKAYAVLTVHFGALDRALPDGRPLPLGLAHFLEHKMFATPDGDVFDVYAQRGAAANAWTTWSSTAYLFGCTSRFLENLGTLLGTVRTVHADAAGIEREKGIIGQEIAMYADDAGWRGHAQLLEALYVAHPVRDEITGSAATIAGIDRALLVATHAAYYHPANTALFVAGDVDRDAVLAAAQAATASAGPGARHRRRRADEPGRVASAERRCALPVARPQVTLGIKDVPPGATGAALAAQEAATDVVLDALFGDGGRIEAVLYRDGVVDDTFGAAYQAEDDFAFVSVGGDVDDERGFRARLEEAFDAAVRLPVGEAEVERARRRAVGGYLRAFDAPERAASMLLGLHEKEIGLRDALEAMLAVTPAQATERLRALAACPRTWSVVEPRGRGAGRAAPGLPRAPTRR